MTISSQKISLLARNLLLFHRQFFLDKHSGQKVITLNQQGTFKTREEFVASAGSQDMNTRSYELSDLADLEFSCENRQLEKDAVFRPGIDTPFSQPTKFDDFEMRGSSKTPLCWMRRKTMRTLLQNLQCLSVRQNLRVCLKIVLLEDGLKLCRKLFVRLCLIKYIVCVCVNLHSIAQNVSLTTFFETSETGVRQRQF